MSREALYQRTVYLWDPNTSDVSVLFSAPQQTRFPAPQHADPELSPDGERVVYEGLRGDTSQIFVHKGNGKEQQLTHGRHDALDPTWSPDGSKIAFARAREGSDTDIYVMDADGSHTRRLVGTPAADGDPDWSPDGARIAFHGVYDVNRSSIWVASIRTQALARLTPRDVFGAMDPAWSPDGRWIAYSWYHGDTLNGRPYSARLWRMRPDGTDQVRITQPDKNSVNENPSWSPDGRLIVFERHNWDWSRNRVLAINPSSGDERSILEGTEAAPSWGQGGILLSLPSGDPAPAPGLAPLLGASS